MDATLKPITSRFVARLRHHPRLGSLLLGLISGLAMPPIDAWWVFGITFPLFLLALEGVTLKRSFQLGWRNLSTNREVIGFNVASINYPSKHKSIFIEH